MMITTRAEILVMNTFINTTIFVVFTITQTATRIAQACYALLARHTRPQV
jgi:hypothetical protein